MKKFPFAILSVLLAFNVVHAEPKESAKPVEAAAAAEGVKTAEGVASPTGGEPSAAPADKNAAVPFARERELAAELELRVPNGEMVWLETDQGRFFGLYLAPTKFPPKGAFVVIPGIQRYASEAGLIDTLREYPPAGGWATFSIQPPRLRAGADAKDYSDAVGNAVARVNAAIRHVNAQGFGNVVLVGEGLGATIARQCLDGPQAAKVLAFVAIGQWTGDIKAFPLPLLDVTGSRDPKARSLADERFAWSQTQTKVDYERLIIDGADRNFAGYAPQVARRIRGWSERMLRKAGY